MYFEKIFERMVELYHSKIFFNKFEIKVLTNKVAKELNFLFIYIFNLIIVEKFDKYKLFYVFRKYCKEVYDNEKFKDFNKLWLSFDNYIFLKIELILNFFNKFILYLKKYNRKFVNWFIVFKTFGFFIVKDFYDWRSKIFIYQRKKLIQEKRKFLKNEISKINF